MAHSDAKQIPHVHEGEAVNGAVSLDDLLRSGESITGTPTMAEVDDGNNDVASPDLSFSNISVTTSEKTIDGNAVAAGRAVTYHMTGQLASNVSYRFRVSFTTDATPNQERIRFYKFNVIK